MRITNVYTLDEILADLAVTEKASKQQKEDLIFYTYDSRGILWRYAIRAKSDTVAKLQQHLDRYRHRVYIQKRHIDDMMRGRKWSLARKAGARLLDYKTDELFIHESLAQHFATVNEAHALALLEWGRGVSWLK